MNKPLDNPLLHLVKRFSRIEKIWGLTDGIFIIEYMTDTAHPHLSFGLSWDDTKFKPRSTYLDTNPHFFGHSTHSDCRAYVARHLRAIESDEILVLKWTPFEITGVSGIEIKH